MSDERLLRYLLDQVPEEERTRIEERFLADEDYYQQLLIVEDELRCAYASGSLGPEERQRFEDRFLTFDDERAKVADARSFVAELAAMPVDRPVASGKNWTARLALAAALILAVAGLSWQAFESRRLRSQLSTLEAQRDAREQALAQQASAERARRDALDRELQDERKTRAVLEQELARQRDQPASNRPPGAVVSLFLTAGMVRGGGETRTIRVSPDASQVRLMLSVEGQVAYRTYDIEILNADGARVWTRAGLPGGGQVVMVTVPATALPEDDYELALRGVTASRQTERAGNYYFRVLK